MSTAPQPTTTSYAILGLLALRPWTTYELTQQMRRSMNSFWPRAESRIYDESKRLVASGFARATRDHVGRRPRTTYEITTEGRRALRRWLAEPAAGPVLEFDALLKVFFAEQAASTSDVLTTIDGVRSWAAARAAENVAFARLYRDHGGPFPDRLASIILVGRFLTDFADMTARWAEWAAAEVGRWPTDGSRAEPAWAFVREVAARDVDPAPLPGSPGQDVPTMPTNDTISPG